MLEHTSSKASHLLCVRLFKVFKCMFHAMFLFDVCGKYKAKPKKKKQIMKEKSNIDVILMLLCFQHTTR